VLSMLINKLPVCISLFVAVTVAASAQSSQIGPSKTLKVTGPAVKDLALQVPRIQNDFGPLIFRPENPKLPTPPGEPNTLSVGLPTSDSRGKLNHPLFPGIGQTQYVPPDCDMAVGPNHIILSVNSAFAIFNKKGTKLIQTDMTNFWAPIEHGSFVFDPCCFYDRNTQRYFVCADDLGTNQCQELFAVSQTSDPTGKWYQYGIDTAMTVGGNSYWMDYPHFGISKDAVAFAGNMFGFTSGWGGVNIVTVPVAPLLTGGTPNASYFQQQPFGTTQPARSYDPTDTTMYAMSLYDGSNATVIAITNAGTNPKLSWTKVGIPTMSAPVSDAVCPQGHYVDGFAGDGRLFDCKKRNGHLLAAHNINGPNNRIEVRWYDIQTNGYPAGTPSFVQAGNVPGGTGFDAFQPAVTMTAHGAIGIVYSKSGDALAPQIDFVSRSQYDALGTVGKPIVVANSLGSTYGSQGVNRWGDYFGIDVDPTDDRTVWVHGMVGNDSGGWQTFVGGYAIGTFLQTGVAASISMQDGLKATGSVSDTYAIDTNYYNVNSVQVAGIGQVASVVATFNKPVLQGSVAAAHLDYDVAGPIGVTNFIYLYNWSARKWDFLKVTPMSTVGETTGSIPLTLAQYGQYLNAAGQAKVLFRAIAPQHLASAPQPFTLRVNMIQFNREEF